MIIYRSYTRKTEAKRLAGGKSAGIEQTAGVGSNRMGHTVVINPSYPRARFDSDGSWIKYKVFDVHCDITRGRSFYSGSRAGWRRGRYPRFLVGR